MHLYIFFLNLLYYMNIVIDKKLLLKNFIK